MSDLSYSVILVGESMLHPSGGAGEAITVSASLLFVHGTGARDVSGLLSRIRDGLAALDVDCDRVIAAEWGRAVGPQALDIDAALPVESDGLSAEDILEKTGDLLEEDEIGQAAIDIVSWELLVADPLLELRILAETAPRDKTSLSPGEVSPVRSLPVRSPRGADQRPAPRDDPRRGPDSRGRRIRRDGARGHGVRRGPRPCRAGRRPARIRRPPGTGGGGRACGGRPRARRVPHP
nr:hypothetical protein GCM10020093_038450 [Planobispora longispora]